MQTIETKALFPVGQTVATPECLAAIFECGMSPDYYLRLHQHGQWGDLGAADKAENDLSVRTGERILSAYVLPNGQRIYCITEWDRSITTLLLVSEY
jgi:hypothetical protein